MDQKEDTKKTGPDQEQQTGQPATKPETGQPADDSHGTIVVELPGPFIGTEPARRCQICEGPNHHACGCEARAAKEKSRIDLNALPKIHYAIDGRPFCNKAQRGAMPPGEKTTENENEATCLACRDLLKPKTGPGPYADQDQAEEFSGDLLKDILSNDLIAEARALSLQQSKDIHTMAESCEDFKIIICDMAATLKVIAGDLITIRKHLLKEEEKNASENQN